MKRHGWRTQVIKRLKPFKRHLGLLVLLTLGTSMLTLVPPILIGKMIDFGIKYKNVSILWFLSTGMLLSYGLQGLLTSLRQYVASLTIHALTRRLRIDLFNSLLHAQFDFFVVTPRGDILQCCIDDADQLQSFSLEILPQFAQELLSAIIAVFIIGVICGPLALIAISSYLLYLIPLKYVGGVQRQVSRGLGRQNANLQQMLQENIESIRLIKIFGTEEREYKRVSSEQEKWTKLIFRRYLAGDTFNNISRILDALVPALVFVVGGWQVFHGTLTVGAIVTMVGLLPVVNAPIRSIADVFLAFKGVGARLERIVEYLSVVPEPGRQKGLQQLKSIRGSIEFRDVSLRSESSLILDRVSFAINPGEHVAIVGTSGSGKSTIIRLIIRLVEPTTGSILIDDRSLQDLNVTSLRQRLGIVPQEIFLFNDSIRNNICYGREFSQDHIEKLAIALGSHNFISALPCGYETIIGNKGVMLSGGQKQQVSILRALVSEPDVLLLDEATSALDGYSETPVKNAIHRLSAKRTCIFVTHRLQTVVNADRILVLDRGRVAEEGHHTELLEKGGVYAYLWQQKKL